MRVVELKALELEQIEALVKGEPNLASALHANLAVVQVLTTQIERLEREILAQVKLAAQFQPLLSIPGVGKILGCASCWRQGRSGASPGWVTSPPIHAVSIATGCRTVRR
jgi:transposase